ncbi:PQQ-dependent catabolism-associated CXXCW motif protein [Pseudomonas nitroreducens]|uniref:PQQ-dependent catabolism-associated CXXCW motif protein n=1 Tax=Pseudomonas nitroreducens TaxID=46680 RepID=UPI00265A59A3|nr:PQQ-dependent catabolism-associated CXXCW motif protein [Pseudomonas nitroreducens]MCP1649474.1 PQQ-dependent catabolism-associated CXXCW motif protein [Pseudomonas nitroreducens]MCP1687798.1 PQQ-dependent catabolism-associated CXXCW motif protein [Pseudomonas nitroreducens]
MPRLASALNGHASGCLAACLLSLTLALPTAQAEDAPLFSADGYRQAQYRSPTPPSADHAVTLDTPALQALLKREPKTRLVDVYRRTFLNGQFVEDEKHRNLPGSLWLANVGTGTLEPQWQAYFEQNLSRLTEGDAKRPLVFYCRSDCWMSWNAIRRAHALGYSNLYWYRDGIDAWEQAGLPLQDAQPQPVK